MPKNGVHVLTHSVQLKQTLIATLTFTGYMYTLY